MSAITYGGYLKYGTEGKMTLQEAENIERILKMIDGHTEMFGTVSDMILKLSERITALEDSNTVR